MISYKIILFKIILAVILGAIIGLQREEQSKNAGLKTHILVALGATTIMVISKYGFFDVIHHSAIVLDPSRISAQVVSGLGFIGAGIIFLNHDSITGLTTSVGIWNTAAIGLAIGAGLYSLAIITTIVIFFVLEFISRFTYKSFKPHVSLFITTTENISEINQYYKLPSNYFKHIRIKIFKIYNNTISFTISFTVSDSQKLNGFYQKLKDNPQIISVEIK